MSNEVAIEIGFNIPHGEGRLVAWMELDRVPIRSRRSDR
jgi:hypothetical protein